MDGAPPTDEPPLKLEPLASSLGMPHAVEGWEKEKEADDELIQQLIAGTGQENDELAGLLEGASGGDGTAKAEDAEDFADISDDDLPDEEPSGVATTNGHEPEAEENADDSFAAEPQFDDLFGDDEGDSFMQDAPVVETPAENAASDDLFGDGDLLDEPGEELSAARLAELDAIDTPAPAQVEPEEEMTELEKAELEEQRRLFGLARTRANDRLARGGIDVGSRPDAEGQTEDQLLETLWPDFDRDEVPQFTKLFMKKRAYYVSKAPFKVPTKVQPTRPALDLVPDQERSFKLTSAPTARKRTNEEVNESGFLFIANEDNADESSDENVELLSLDGDEMIGGVSVQDLRVLCEDWDSLTNRTASESDFELLDAVAQAADSGNGLPPAKRRKTELERLLQPVTQDELLSFDDPEGLTAKLAKRVFIDENDDRLLLDIKNPEEVETVPQTTFVRRREVGGVSSAIHKKFNFSNDEEYERLVKENSIRGAVGNIPVEHSLPARRLQYPFYKTTMNPKELRNFHRPLMQFTKDVRIGFEKRLGYQKIKELRKMTVREAFPDSGSLTLADNSSMMLLEYSEEYPLLMSNNGMNSRIVNYYRRKDEHDKFRPKEEIGEPKVLMEKDQSPFAKFGFVDPGQMLPTLHNNLFRAPVFRHESKHEDFLVIRRQTGIHGVKYHLRNIENLHVVGQQFPSAEVPGTHGRKVTSTQKSRMKMIAFRIYHHKMKNRGSKQPYVPHTVITQHFPGSDVGQNRSKMREIMSYNKEHSTWEPKAEDLKYLDMDFLRNEIKPEDICLIDSMQVGARQMQDAGFDLKQIDDDKDAGEDASIDAQLVHWRATKNFLAACGDNAMIALHGEGDPTGRGEGFSFVKISMKGGFQAIGSSINERMNARNKSEGTGHKYNVRDQETAYQQAIRQIWDSQNHSLSATEAPDLDLEMDDNIDARIERTNSLAYGRTPRSEAPGTPASYMHGNRGTTDIDDSTSHVSGSRISDGRYYGHGDRVLKITRRRKTEYGDWVEETQMVDDPVVARQYKKRKDLAEQQRLEKSIRENLAGDGTALGGGENDPETRRALEAELNRLIRNQERRKVREAQKAAKIAAKTGQLPPGFAQAGGAEGEEGPDGRAKVLPGQTLRKCANCGQYGHIKTNKKLCPMLNGMWKDGVPPGSDAPSSGAGTPGPGDKSGGGDRPGAQNRLMSSSFNF